MPVTGPVGLSWFGVATTRDGPPIRGIIRGTVSPRPRPRWVTAPFHPGDIRHSPSGSGRLGCHHEFLSRSSGPPAGSTGPPPAPRRLSPSGGRSISHAGSADHPVGGTPGAYSHPCGWLGGPSTPRRVPAGRAGSLSLGLRVGSGSASGVASIFGLIPLTSFWRGWSCSSPWSSA
jgi:hypothetical protein